MNIVESTSHILSKATAHVVKLVNFVSLVMAKIAPPDVAKVMEILQYFPYLTTYMYSSPLQDEFNCLYTEAKIEG